MGLDLVFKAMGREKELEGFEISEREGEEFEKLLFWEVLRICIE